MRIPVATYRLQIHQGLCLRRATELVGYLHDLGVGDCYAPPLLAAMPGTNHGYDVIDHSRVHPELGTEADLVAFATELSRRGMGLLLDVVPNHMCVARSQNRWWNDVLENGPSSPFARFFDIDWLPPKADLRARVLLPILGDQFGCVLEDRAIQVRYEDDAFIASYYEHRLPIAPRTWYQILEPALGDLRARVDASDPKLAELESILTALRHLPLRTDTEEARVRERLREKEIIKRRLRELLLSSPEAKRAVKDAVTAINGRAGDPASVDALEALLADQGYRPSFWRVASDEINYRRFFDINDLAAIRVEEPTVFRAVHELPLRLARRGLITGLRIDHVDGLLAPAQYLEDLQHMFGPFMNAGQEATADGSAYVVVEKILGPGERLPDGWPVAGTTGYEFTSLITSLFVRPDGLESIRGAYASFTGQAVSFEDVVYDGKKLVLKTAMSAELTVLARKLDVISEQHRTSRDFTLTSLQEALGELIACFPVYRTYVGPDDNEVTDTDKAQIECAVREAKHRNPATSGSVFDFLRDLLLLKHPSSLDAADLAARRDFVLRFQQLTGPVMAKGFEDTAFYRYLPLAALNEVGGGHQGALSVEAFHEANKQRLTSRPHGMNATSTHDTKRGEDVRTRLCALSEIAPSFTEFLDAAREASAPLKPELGGERVPESNDEYLLYQTVLGAWPAGESTASEDFVRRIQEYMLKAQREAKRHTSWVNPNEEYERAVSTFVAKLLDPATGAKFLGALERLHAKVVNAGWVNSLSQVVLKIGVPGVPDFYQGCELWDLVLVDPDNRRPVDFDRRMNLLAAMRREAETDTIRLIGRMRESADDGRLKMFVTHRGLTFRRDQRELFERGGYEPIRVEGTYAPSVVAFTRQLGSSSAIFVASRFSSAVAPPPEWPIGPRWGATRLAVPKPAGRYKNVLTGETLELERSEADGTVALSRVLAHLPVAILEAES